MRVSCRGRRDDLGGRDSHAQAAPHWSQLGLQLTLLIGVEVRDAPPRRPRPACEISGQRGAPLRPGGRREDGGGPEERAPRGTEMRRAAPSPASGK